jgi:hypothetical protein
MKSAQHDADARWQLYEQVAGVHRVVTEEGSSNAAGTQAAVPPATSDKPSTATPSQETTP